MENMYETTDSCEYDAFGLSNFELVNAIKGEVALVQGSRKIYKLATRSFSENYQLEFDSNASNIADDGDITRVTTLTWHVRKASLNNDAEKDDAEKIEMMEQAERMFTAFCWQFRIPFIPKFDDDGGTKAQNIYRQYANKSQGDPPATESRKYSVKNPNDFIPLLDEIGLIPGATGGGGGGGKRPPKRSTKKTLPADYMHSEETSAEPAVSSSESGIESIPVLKRKKKIVDTSASLSNFIDNPTASSTSLLNKDPSENKLEQRRSSNTASETSSEAPNESALMSKEKKRTQAVTISASSSTILEGTAQSSISGKRKKLKRVTELDPSYTESHEGLKKTKTNLKVTISPKVTISNSPSVKSAQGASSPSAKVEQETHESESQNNDLYSHRIFKSNRRKSRRHSLKSLQSNILSDMGHARAIQIKERDSEWLEWINFEDEKTPEEEKSADPEKKENNDLPLNPFLQTYLNSVNVYDKLLTIFGLNPYKKVVRENKCLQLKWDKQSGKFYTICVHAILFFMITMTALSSLLHIAYANEKSVTALNKILQIDFANHVTQCLFLVFISIFLSIWSVSCVMELGIHYAEFMTRFNYGICLINYDVSEGIRQMSIYFFSFIGAIEAFIITMFFAGRTTTSVVREGCGFMGYAVIRPFNYAIRTSIYFPLVELLGLVIAIYIVISFSVVIFQLAVYAKALENMANTLGLRMLYALGKTAARKADGTAKIVKKVIPLQKIYAEHTIITSLFKHFGHVNAVIFNSFMLAMALQIMLMMWIVFTIVGDRITGPYKTWLDRVGIVNLAVPLKWRASDTESLGLGIVYTSLIVPGFFTFGGMMHKASDTLHLVVEYVRRHGFILCKNSKEKRFVLLMITSFSPKAQYWIGKSFPINKAFMIAFMGFITSASMVLASFHPSRTNVTSIEQCDESGQCVVFRLPRSYLDRLYAAVPLPQPIPTPTFFPIVTLPPTLPPINNLDDPLPKYSFLHPTCITQGEIRFDIAFYAGACTSSWNVPQYPDVIFTPALIKPFERDDSSGKIHKYFGQMKAQFAEYPASSLECATFSNSAVGVISPPPNISPCVSDTFACRYFPFESAFGSPTSSDIVDCFGHPVNISIVDDCGNVNVNSPERITGKRVETKLRVMSTIDISFLGVIGSPSLLCCYEYYSAYPNAPEQAKVCNMPNAQTFNALCQFGTDRTRMTGDVLQLHDEILKRIIYQSNVVNDPDYLLRNQDIIVNCLCKLDGSSPNETEIELCRFLALVNLQEAEAFCRHSNSCIS